MSRSPFLPHGSLTYHPVDVISSAEPLGFCTYFMRPSSHTQVASFSYQFPASQPSFSSLISLAFALLLPAQGSRHCKTQNQGICTHRWPCL